MRKEHQILRVINMEAITDHNMEKGVFKGMAMPEPPLLRHWEQRLSLLMSSAELRRPVQRLPHLRESIRNQYYHRFYHSLLVPHPRQPLAKERRQEPCIRSLLTGLLELRDKHH